MLTLPGILFYIIFVCYIININNKTNKDNGNTSYKRGSCTKTICNFYLKKLKTDFSAFPWQQANFTLLT